ncbi:hypothetical protein [Georgenia sp. AZ-5]|uniref:hypothetical protein n=1 Tax=Georgenia sp. AZ-5 TaxID=3367526 RepID=UPI003754B0F1
MEASMVIEAVAAITWQESGEYSARCLGVADLTREAGSMESAVEALREELTRVLSPRKLGFVGQDDTRLWQPLPVEMIVPLDVEVAR